MSKLLTSLPYTVNISFARTAAFAGLLALTAACGGNRIETTGSTPGGGDPGSSGGATATTSTPTEPQFRKEGTLEFLTTKGDTLSKIDIEVAATDAEREQGLMFRTNIAEPTGMLFLFDEADYQSFWMKNTPSSLDIIFVSPKNEILNIHSYTSPYSMEGLPSKGLSNKVVEVKAGYCDKYKIKPGDKISYRLSM